MQIQYNDKVIEYRLSASNIQIKDSYLITNQKQMRDIVQAIRVAAYEEGYEYKRTNDSWVREWAAHNLLYDWNFKRDRTGTVDLSENESGFKRFCYCLLSLLYRK